MFTTASEEFPKTKFSSSRTANKTNLLAILFFLMGAPHIYSFLQTGRRADKNPKAKYGNKALSIQSVYFSKFALLLYLSILILGVLAAETSEIFIF